MAFELPTQSEMGKRLAAVLEVIYLIFNEGYSATAGDNWMRPALCEEAMRLARILAGLVPDEPEVHGRADGAVLGVYTLQAAIAACHARAARPDDTDWERISALYEVLRHTWPSPVVDLNRAVAAAMVKGPAEGLKIVDAVAGSPELRGYPQLPAVRGDLLSKLGRFDEARVEYEAAAAATRNAGERAAFLGRAAVGGQPRDG